MPSTRAVNLGDLLPNMGHQSRSAVYVPIFVTRYAYDDFRIKIANRRVGRSLRSQTYLSMSQDWICSVIDLNHDLFCPSSFTASLDKEYRLALSVLDSEVKDLLVETVIRSNGLDNLDHKLGTVMSLVHAELADVRVEKDGLSGSIWTALGFHKKRFDRIVRSMETLASAGNYTRNARHHIAATYTTLDNVASDIEELRKSTKKEWLSLEESLGLIEAGIARLEAGQTLAKQHSKLVSAEVEGGHSARSTITDKNVVVRTVFIPLSRTPADVP